VSAVAKIRKLFRRKPSTEEQRRRREEARRAEDEILERRVELRAAAMGVPEMRLDEPEDESQRSED
jgi:hypothetical protein